MLQDLNREDFAGCLHSAFDVLFEGQEPLPLELIELQEHDNKPGPSATYTSFSLVFRGTAAMPLPQGTYLMKHKTMGELALFISPFQQDAEWRYYEAIINRQVKDTDA